MLTSLHPMLSTDVSEATLVDLAALVAGVRPGSPEAQALQAQLDVLADLPPAYTTATRIALESLAEARHWQEHALRDLTPVQRELVRHADPEAPISPALHEALGHVDMSSVAAELAALQVGSMDLLRVVQGHAGPIPPDPHGAAAALGSSLQIETFHGSPVARSITPAAVAHLLATATGGGGEEAAQAMHQLEGLPVPVLEALAILAEGVHALAEGDARAGLVRLGAAADAAAPALRIWSAVVLADQLRPTSLAQQSLVLPDPAVPVPPLRWARQGWTDGMLLPVDTTLPEAAQRLAGLFVGPEAAQVAGREAGTIAASLTPEQIDAVTRVLDAVQDHVESHRASAASSLPDGVTLGDLSRWADMAGAGTMPTPGSQDAARLLASMPFLETQRRAASATDQLLQAIEELVPAFQAASAAVPETPGCQRDARILFLLALDTCGGDSVWAQDVILRIDVGGDDAYTARIGAPFAYNPAGELPPGVADGLLGIPIAISLDLGGSDDYTTSADCAQGAACPDHPSSALDPTGVSAIAPLAVLVDWDGDDVAVRNTFQAGHRSQGFHALTSPVSFLGRPFPTDAVAGILVERVGLGSTLDSTYTAGDRSQGAGVDSGTSSHGGRGVLVRLVGEDSIATASFEAGDSSQASVFQGGGRPVTAVANYVSRSLGAFLNVAGPGATSTDAYTAGPYSQAAIDGSRGSPEFADAIFADVAGPGGAGDDAYHLSGQPGRAYLLHPFSENGLTTHRSMYALFIDAALPATAEPGELLEVDVQDNRPTLEIAPSVGGGRVSNDTYDGPIQPGNGYGWSTFVARSAGGGGDSIQGGFYDLAGDDVYALPEGAWSSIDPESRPRNDGTWPGGMDIGVHDDDVDGYPAALEQLWPFWAADPNDQRESPHSLRMHISLDEHRDTVLDGPYALVLSLGGDDLYLADHSAALHIDVAGDDVNLGRAGATGTAQNIVSALLDLQGDDRYESEVAGNQGYGGSGVGGVLLDMAGNDRYVAPSAAQGVAQGGVVGALIDLGVPGAGERNWFQAAAPSQGHSDGAGIGLLVATGDHNTFAGGIDGDPVDGASVNLGANQPPEIGDIQIHALEEQGLSPATQPFVPEQPYRFEASVRDPDGDPVQVCWVFEHGDPTSHGVAETTRDCGLHGDGWVDAWQQVETTFTWDRQHQVHTDGTVPGLEAHITYDLLVEATDAGGASTQVQVPIQVSNKPPTLLGGVVGRSEVSLGDREAYQLPFLLEDDMFAPRFVVDWGDGSRTVVEGDTIDWARASYGATVRTPEAVPRVVGGTLTGVSSQGLAQVIDGDPQTEAVFRFDPVDFPLVHVLVEFPAERQVGRIGLDATALSMDFDLSIEGLDPQGRPLPFGTITVGSEGAGEDIVIADRPLLSGILVRQMLPADGTIPPGGFLNIGEIRAAGPGVEKEWDRAGVWDMTFAVIDELGGRNATNLEVHVQAQTGQDDQDYDETRGDVFGIPLRLVDVADRGMVRHASVAAYPTSVGELGLSNGDDLLLRDARDRALRLQSLTDEGVGNPCVSDEDGYADGVCLSLDWGDGSVERFDMPAEGDLLEVFHRWTTPGDHLVTVTYETGAGAIGPSPVTTVHVEQGLDLRLDQGEAGSTPILFLTLDNRTTWQTGAPYAAIVDAGGDDRYFDLVASPSAGPSLVVDVGGDDDYLSALPRTQGFGALAVAALLLDATGDDRYVAPGRAQGAAETSGAGMLIDLGGDDAWNLIPHDHPAVDAGRPDRFLPWPETDGARPDALRAVRPALRGESGSGFELMQGAAQEGIGVMVAAGGVDLFVAGDRSQGYGTHDPRVDDVVDYALYDQGCLALLSPSTDPAVAQFYNQFLCALGIQIPAFQLPNSPPVGCPPIGLCNPNAQGLNQFLSEGPRYGPGLGLLLRPDGPSAMRAGSYSQAASEESGRGLLVDLDGATVMSAKTRSQALTIGGSSVLVVGGPHSTWLQDQGQFLGAPGDRNPEGLGQTPPQLLVYAGGPRDARCEGDICGLGTEAPVAIDSEADPTPGLPGPTLSWGLGLPDLSSGLPAHRADTLHLEIDVADASTGSTETVVLAMVHPGHEGDSCQGEPIAGPIVLGPWAQHPAGTTSFSVDQDLFETLTDGRLLPAGCYRVHAFARNLVADGAPTEWTTLAGEFRLLPPPSARLIGSTGTEVPSIATGGAPMPVTVFVPEPLAAAAQGTAAPIVEPVVTHLDGAAVDGWSFTPQTPWTSVVDGEQVGASRVFVIEPPQVPGTYALMAHTAWSGAAPEEVGMLATLTVDSEPPVASLDATTQDSWRGGRQIPLAGTVHDAGVGVDRLELRAVHDTPACAVQDPEASCLVRLYIPSLAVDPFCSDARPHHCTLEVVPSFPVGQRPTRPCPSESCQIVPPPFTGPGALPATSVTATSQEAVLRPTATPGAWAWSVSMRTTGGFPGGAVILQARAIDEGGVSTGWQGLTHGEPTLPQDGQRLLIDKSAPEAIQVSPAGGTVGTNRVHPIPIEVVLRDCAADSLLAQQCIPGSGVSPEGIVAMVRDMQADTLIPIEAGQVEVDGDRFLATLSWDGPSGGPEQGEYQVLVQMRDNAGNILSLNPGATLFIDRESPSFLASTARFTLPEGQTAVKPDDDIAVVVRARDAGTAPTWVARVAVDAGGDESLLSVESTTACALEDPTGCLRVRDGVFAGTATVASGLLAEGEEDAGLPLRVSVVASDAGGNEVLLQSTAFTFYEREPDVLDLEVTRRSESIDVSWRTMRAVEVGPAMLFRQDGQGAPVEGTVTSDGLSHDVRFSGLSPMTTYTMSVPMQDAAGHVLDLNTLGAVSTVVKADAGIVLHPPAAGAYAGLVTLDATIMNAVQSTVTLYESPSGIPLTSLDIDPEHPGLDDLTVPVRFDSRLIQQTLSGVRDVNLVLVMDDGESDWSSSLVLRIDNARPTVAPFVVGPAPHPGSWYNASVVVHANAQDDTPPLAHTVTLDGGVPQAKDRVKVVAEGEHVVVFSVRDGAVEPNVRTVETRFAIDKTPPIVDSMVAGGATAVREPEVPLSVSAIDPGAGERRVAGVSGLRVRLDDGPWTGWSATAPTAVTIPDGPGGHHWVHIEARDAAHNVARTSVPLILDRAPPEVLAMAWIGTSDGTEVLEFVAHDRLDGPGRPSGLVAMRLGPLESGVPVGPRTETGGVGSVQVPSSTQQMAVQFFDAAGNSVVALIPARPGPAGESADPGSGSADPDSDPETTTQAGNVLRDGRFVPDSGSASEPFTFSVLVQQRDSVGPDSVWLIAADKRVQMLPDPVVLDDDSRLYTVTLALPPTSLGTPHTYHFEALYGSDLVASSAAPGPLVTRLGDTELQDTPADEEQEVPSLAPLLLIALLLLGAIRRRRNHP